MNENLARVDDWSALVVLLAIFGLITLCELLDQIFKRWVGGGGPADEEHGVGKEYSHARADRRDGAEGSPRPGAQTHP